MNKRFKKQFLELLCVAFVITGLLGCSTNGSKTESQAVFTNESLKGNYAVVFTTGANIAAGLGVCNFDGEGNHTCTFTNNMPHPKTVEARLVVQSINTSGTYQVNEDGTGAGSDQVNSPESEASDNDPFDFVITRAEVGKEYAIATEIVIHNGVPGPGGNSGELLTLTLTRLPQ